MKLHLIVLGLMLLMGISCAWADNAPTPAQNEALKKALANMQPSKCPDDKLILEVRNIKFAMPRYDTRITLSTGKRIEDLDHQCDIKYLRDIMGFSGGGAFGVQDASKNPSFETTYESYKKYIDDDLRTGRVKIVADGVRRLWFGKSEIYLLSVDKIHTLNKEPVAFECDGNEEDRKQFMTERCSGSYVMPNGLIFGYYFNRRDYPPHPFLRVNQENIKLLESLEVKTVQPADQEK
jgi:hypothetical protein